MSVPVSAFAARRAVARTNKQSPQSADPAVDASSCRRAVAQHAKDDEAGSRPRKKRKRTRDGPFGQRSKHSQTPITQPSPPQTPHQNEVHNALEPAVTGNLGPPSESSSESSDEGVLCEHAMPSLQLSTFQPNEVNVLSETEREWNVKLGRKDTLAIVGEYDLWVKRGAVSISGAVFHAGPELHRIYAPSTNGLPILRTIYDPYGSGTQAVVVSIRSCGSGMRRLKHLSPKFGRLWNGSPALKGQEPGAKPHRRSFSHLQNSADDTQCRSLKPLELPGEWQKSLQRISTGPCGNTLICGPKSSGKSTFCRLLSNTLLSRFRGQQKGGRVYLLELDPGQPEYTASGDISLLELTTFNLGVPFTHPAVLEGTGNYILRSHHIGFLSPRDDSKHYLECALNLLQLYQSRRETHTGDALLINCPGWIQGTGLDLLAELILASKASEVLFMSTSGPEDVTNVLSEVCTRTKSSFHQLPAQSLAEVTRTASDLRTMQTMSYFHLREPESGNLRWDPRPMTERRPLTVPYSGPNQAIFAVVILGDEQTPELISSILNGSVVGLVLLEDDKSISKLDSDHAQNHDGLIDQGYVEQNVPERRQCNVTLQDDTQPPNSTCPTHLQHTSIRRSPLNLPYLPAINHTTTPLSPTYTHSLGQALIRSIDPIKQCINLITPIPVMELQRLHRERKKIVLVRGKLDIPSWAFKEEVGYEQSMRERKKKAVQEGDDGDAEMEGIGGEEDGTKAMVERQPWLTVVEEGKRAKARKVRRDIRYKPVSQ